MSYSVSGTMITLTRGDTFSALITITDLNDNQYIPMNGDRIRFAMKNDYKDRSLLRSFRITCLTWKRFLRMLLVRSLPVLQRSFPQMGRTSLRPWFMGNKMQFEAVACRLFLHYSYTLAQKASNYGIFCFSNKKKRAQFDKGAAPAFCRCQTNDGVPGVCRGGVTMAGHKRCAFIAPSGAPAAPYKESCHCRPQA